MNKAIVGGIIGVLVIGAVAIFYVNSQGSSDANAVQNNDAGNTISRPAVQAVPNTFSIMTPEEKAAADEAARLQAEAEAELAASSSATSSDDTETDGVTEAESTN